MIPTDAAAEAGGPLPRRRGHDASVSAAPCRANAIVAVTLEPAGGVEGADDGADLQRAYVARITQRKPMWPVDVSRVSLCRAAGR